jgi:hypothetical protein
MPQPIKKSDIIENDILKSVIVEFENAKKVTDDYNKALKQTASLLKTKLSDTKIFDSNSVKEHNMAIKEANMLFNQKLKAEEQLKKNAILEEKIVAQQIKNKKLLNKETENEIKAQNRSQSIYMKFNDELRKTREEYRDLAIRKVAFNDLSKKEESQLSRLENKVQQYDKALKKVDASMGMHQRNVGNYASGNATLSNSVNQLTREMPAFANSVSTGFMAISNNLPIFFDEIKKIKQANIELQSTGQPTQSVLKQVATSVFSLGTALSIGVTLLTIYGAKIIDWMTNSKELSEELKNLKKTSEDLRLNNEIETRTFNSQVEVLKKLKTGSKERKNLIDEINTTYGTTLENLSNEEDFLKMVNIQQQEYINKSRERLEIKLNEEKAEYLIKKARDANNRAYLASLEIDKLLASENKDVEDGLRSVYQDLRKMTAEEMKNTTAYMSSLGFTDKGKLIDAMIERWYGLEEAKNANARADELLTINAKKASTIQADPKKTKKSDNIKFEKDLTYEIKQENINRIADENKKQIEILKLNAEKNIKQLNDEVLTNEEIAKLRGKDLVNYKKFLIDKDVLIKEINQTLIFDLLQLNKKYLDELEKQEQEWINEKRKIIQDAIKEEFESEQQQLENAYNVANKKLEIENKTRETNLLNSKSTDEEIKNMTLKNQIDMLEKKLELAIKYDKKEEESNIRLELAKLNRQENNLESIKLAYKTMSDLVKQYTELEITQSQKRVNQLDKEITQRQKAFDLYSELAKNGNIIAQQSLAEEQKAIVEANKKKEQEAKRQQRLKFAESTFSAYANNVEKGEKNPLLKTITDMTLLRQFIMSLPAFEKGIEDTGTNGKGIDGKGGFLSILHPNERVLTKEQNNAIGGLSNDEVSNTIAKYRSGQLVNIKNVDVAGNSFDIAPLLSEIKDLKNVIKQKPETNIQLGEITQHAMTIVETKTKGNTRINNKYIVR